MQEAFQVPTEGAGYGCGAWVVVGTGAGVVVVFGGSVEVVGVVGGIVDVELVVIGFSVVVEVVDVEVDAVVLLVDGCSDVVSGVLKFGKPINVWESTEKKRVTNFKMLCLFNEFDFFQLNPL